MSKDKNFTRSLQPYGPIRAAQHTEQRQARQEQARFLARPGNSPPTFIEFQSKIIYHASQSQRMSNSRGALEGETQQPAAMRSRMSERVVITLAVMIGMWLGRWWRL